MHRLYKKAILVIGLLFLLTACSKDEPIHGVNKMKENQETASVSISDMKAELGTDVVIVMDKSDSMDEADSERIAIEGAKLFVDMEKLSNVSIGLVEFSDKATATEMLDAAQQEYKDNLKEKLDQIKNNGYTDTGAALLEAVSLLDGSGANRNKIIILFTDGEIDINPKSEERTKQVSRDDVDRAVGQAQEKGYAIYCIGLNADGKMDKEMLELLEQMSADTGGECLIAENVSSITDFFETIFASKGNTHIDPLKEYIADGEYLPVRFQIDNANILEANIIILSSKKIEDIQLLDTAGNPVDLTDSERFIFSKSQKYSMVKLIHPDVGEWCISVKGISGDAIKISKIINYDINLLVEVDDTALTLGDSFTVRACFLSGGQKIVDSGFYGSLQGEVIIRNQNMEEVEKRDFSTWDKNGVEEKIQLDRIGEYLCMVHIQGSGFYRDSEEIMISVMKQPPIIRKEISSITVLAGKEHSIDLDEYFVDPDGDVLYYSVKAGNSDMSADLTGATLVLKNDVSQQVEVTVYAGNGAESDACLKFAVTTITFWDLLKRFLPIPIIACILIILFLLNRRSKEVLSGVFKVDVESFCMDEFETGNRTPYDIPAEIQAEKLGKHGFELRMLLKLLPGYFYGYDDEKTCFGDCIQQMKDKAGKVKFRGSRQPFELKISGMDDSVKFVKNGGESARKTVVISLRNTASEKFSIRFREKDSKDYKQLNIIYRKM